MPLHRIARRAATLVVALVLGGGVVSATAPALASTVTTPRDIAAARQSVWLPTGDVVLYDAAHPTQVRVRTRATSGPGRSWRSIQRGGDLYVFPLAAAPFLGTVLDPSLFDVTSLAKAGPKAIVHVSSAGGTSASVPGLTVSARSAGTQTGYFTHAGARAFGAALQKAAVQAHGSATAARSLFGASSISGSAPGSGPIVPQFQQQTVIFKALGADGKPLPEGLLFYGNLDDAARGSDFAFIVDGEVRVSLPAGHYTLFSEADTFTETSSDSRIITDPGFVVTGKANQTTTIDFRTATAIPSASVPKPSVLQEIDVIYDREWATGGFTDFFAGDASSTIRVAPAPAPTIGTATFDTDFIRTGTGAGTPSLYDTYFSSPGAISVDQAHTVSAGQLAQVDEHLDTDRAGKVEYFGHAVVGPDGGLGSFYPLSLPLTRLDYLLAPKGYQWMDTLLAAPTDDNPFNGEVDDGLRSYAPGSHSSAEWQRQVVAPSVPAFTPGDIASGVSCPACRVGAELTVAVVPFQDSFPTGHYGFVADPATGELAAHATLYRNGVVIDDEPGSNAVDATVPAGGASYRLVVDSTPGVAGITLGTEATTAWTFSSSAGAGGPLPDGFSCSLDDSASRCTVLPLLRVVAPLPTDPAGGMSVGAHRFDFHISPTQGAPATTVSAGLRISFDDGHTFTPVPITALGGDCFRATITNPASATGTTPLVRFTGTDAAGGTITETVHAAYRVTAN